MITCCKNLETKLYTLLLYCQFFLYNFIELVAFLGKLALYSFRMMP